MSNAPRLPHELLLPAIILWEAGLNTAEIASDLRGSKKHEPEVYNALADWREQEYRDRETAA